MAHKIFMASFKPTGDRYITAMPALTKHATKRAKLQQQLW